MPGPYRMGRQKITPPIWPGTTPCATVAGADGIGTVFAFGAAGYLSTMQTFPLIIGALAIALSAGCRNKQELPGASAHPASAPADPVRPTAQASPDGDGTVAPAEDSVFFSLERTPCFGTCPTYKITILPDGTAYYDGRRFAEREGHFTGHVDAATLAKLKETVVASGFFGMEDKYDQPVTDLPSLIIRMRADGRNKQVIGRVGTPQAFKDLARNAEKLLGGVVWTKVDDGEEH